MRTWILQRYQTYARITLWLGIFLSPVVFHRGTQDVFNLLKFTVLVITGVAAAAVYVIWSAERGIWVPRFNLLYATGAFLFACLLATIFSQNPIVSLIGLYHRYGGLLPFLLYAVIMIVIVGLYWEKPTELRDIPQASTLASVLLALYVLIQAAGQDWIPWRDSSGGPPPYPVGTMGNSNFAGAYLGIALPFVVYMAATAKRDIYKVALWIFVAFDVLALWFTQTRGGMIAAGTGLAAMAFAYRDRLPRRIKIAAVIAVALAVVLSGIVLFHPGSDRPPAPFDRIEVFRTGTFNIRTFYWTTALRIGMDNPVVGVGLDQYYANYPPHRLPEDGAQLGLTITDKPHNIFLEYFSNAGVLGLGSYLVLVGLALWYGLTRSGGEGKDKSRALLVAFLGVLAGYLGQGVFSIDVPPLAFMGWLGIAGIAAIADPRIVSARQALSAVAPGPRGKGKAKKARRPQQSGTRVARYGATRWPVHITAVVLAGAVAFFGALPLRADAKVKEASGSQSTESAGTDRLYDEAIRLHPFEASYRSQAGAWQESLANKSQDKAVQKDRFEKALAYFEEAHRMQQGNIFYLLNIARVKTSMAEKLDANLFPEAERWWRRVVDHDPNDWDVRNRYALMLNAYANSKQGDRTLRERTAVELEKSLAMKKDHTTGWINLAKVYASLGDVAKAQKAVARALALEPANEEAVKLSQTLSASVSPTATGG